MTGSFEVIYSMMVDYFFFGYVPDQLSFIGSAIIVGSVLAVMSRKLK